MLSLNSTVLAVETAFENLHASFVGPRQAPQCRNHSPRLDATVAPLSDQMHTALTLKDQCLDEPGKIGLACVPRSAVGES